MEGLEHTEEMVQAWWTDNMIGEEFPVYSGRITIGFSSNEAGLTEYVDEWPVDKGFWDPYLETDYDSSSSDRRWILFCANSLLCCFWGVTGRGYQIRYGFVLCIVSGYEFR